MVGPQGSDGNGFTVAHRGIAAELDALGFEEADLGFQCVREFRRAELPAGVPLLFIDGDGIPLAAHEEGRRHPRRSRADDRHAPGAGHGDGLNVAASEPFREVLFQRVDVDGSVQALARAFAFAKARADAAGQPRKRVAGEQFLSGFRRLALLEQMGVGTDVDAGGTVT